MVVRKQIYLVPLVLWFLAVDVIAEMTEEAEVVEGEVMMLLPELDAEALEELVRKSIWNVPKR